LVASEIILPDVFVSLTDCLGESQDVVTDIEVPAEALTVTEIPESIEHKMSAPCIIFSL
jgi:hypothetical protein